MHPCVSSSTVHNGQDTETTEMSTDSWLDKMRCIHTTENYLAIKTEIMSFAATRMDLEIIILSEVGQKEK